MRQAHVTVENHPVISMLYLVMLAIGGAVIFSAIGVAVGAAIYGLPGNLMTGDMDMSEREELGFMKVLQIFSSVGLFMVPPFILARIESRAPLKWLKLTTPVSALLLMITVAFMLAATPVLELTVELNKAMKLPEFLREIEAWMLIKEQQMHILTKQLLIMKDPGDLALNMLMIAILPAIGEELFFRGGVQRLFISWTKNYHIGIWIAAIIFSAIHVQFYGFFPRMLLGVFFGYLLVWSGNIWYPIIAHFVNNGATVVAAYVYQQQGKSLDELDAAAQASWPAYVVSVIVLTGLLIFFKRSALKLHEQDAPGLD